MTAVRQNVEMIKGDTARLKFTVATTDGTDFTGCGVAWAMATSATAVALVSKSSTGGGIAIDSSGLNSLVFTVTLDPVDTSGLDVGSYYHEAEVTLAGGDVHTVAIGMLSLAEDLV